MKYILILLALFFPAFSESSSKYPDKGDWVCWVTSDKNQDCGTFGWAMSKPAALSAAMTLCYDKCDSSCRLEYCEKVR